MHACTFMWRVLRRLLNEKRQNGAAFGLATTPVHHQPCVLSMLFDPVHPLLSLIWRVWNFFTTQSLNSTVKFTKMAPCQTFLRRFQFIINFAFYNCFWSCDNDTYEADVANLFLCRISVAVDRRHGDRSGSS